MQRWQAICVFGQQARAGRRYSVQTAFTHLPADSTRKSVEAVTAKSSASGSLSPGDEASTSSKAVLSKGVKKRSRTQLLLKKTERKAGGEYQKASLASTLEEDSDAGDFRLHRSPLEPNKVDLYLASLHTADKDSTIDDIKLCRPKRRPSGDSPGYATEYNKLVDRLCRSFTKSQLRRFGQYYGEKYGLDGCWKKSRRRQTEYATAIIEKIWGWANLNEIEKKERDTTEVITKSFQLSASELFLLLGRDGSKLLQISKDYNVHISVKQSPLALCVEGLRGTLKQIDDLLTNRKKSIIEETIELPSKSPIRFDLLQRISRLAGAFIENVGTDGMVRICANNLDHLVGAKRLAIRAAAHDAHASRTPYLAHFPPELEPSLSPLIFSHTYALYPFLPQQSLPWIMKVGAAFRTRKVGKWLSGYIEEEAGRNGGLTDELGILMDSSGAVKNLRSTLLSAIPTHSFGLNRIVTASTGHVLLSQSLHQRTSLSPPFPGHWQFTKFLKWLSEGNAYRTFIPSLPAGLHNTPSSEQKMIHRLIYRSSPPSAPNPRSDKIDPSEPRFQATKIINFEVTLNQQGVNKQAVHETHMAGSSLDPDPFDGDLEPAANTFELEQLPLSVAETSPLAIYQDSSSESHLDKESITDISESPRYLKGVEAEFDLTLPHKPMDLKMSVMDFESVPWHEAPAEMRHYYSCLQTFLRDADSERPNPPVHLTDGVDNYTLEVNAIVRRSNEIVNAATAMPDIDLDGGLTMRSVETVTESILDLETNQKSMTCQVECDKVSSDEAWTKFLSDCDQLTNLSYKPNSSSLRAVFTDNNDTFA